MSDFTSFNEFIQFFNTLSEADKIRCAAKLSKKQLLLANKDGWAVAHELANRGYFPRKLMTGKNLRIATKRNNWTVAHVLAKKGRLPVELMTKEIMKLTSLWKVTVTHTLAESGYLPERCLVPELLLLQDIDDLMVLDYYLIRMCDDKRWDLLNPAFLEIEQEVHGEKIPFLPVIIDSLMEFTDNVRKKILENIDEESACILYEGSTNNLLKEEINKIFDILKRQAEVKALENISTREDDFIPGFYFGRC